MSITKRYRVVLDYEVEIRDWSEESLADEYAGYEDVGTPEFTEWEGHQQRLFEALMKDPNRVEQFCQRAVLDLASWDGAEKEFDVPSENDLIVDAFKDLSPADAAYWRGSFNGEFFYPSMVSCTFQSLETDDEVPTKLQAT
jgi:hypothetical protein